jgi:hypothetical protein
MHYQHVGTWPTDTVRWQDGILEAKSKKALVGHGARCTDCRRCAVPGNKWLEIAMIRVNHNGTKMDAEDYNTNGAGNVNEVVTREAGPQGRHGRDQHEAGGEGASPDARTGRRR